MATNALPEGFSDPVHQAQDAFRVVMDAMARPGRIAQMAHNVPAPPPLSGAAAAIVLTLCDHETPVWLDAPLAEQEEVIDYLRFHTSATITRAPQNAAFALISSPKDLTGLGHFPQGDAQYPDRSATLVMMVDDLAMVDHLAMVDDLAMGGQGLERQVLLEGPGIETQTGFAAAPLPEGFWRWAQDNHARYPLGLDFLFCAPDRLAALPRSTKITLKG